MMMKRTRYLFVGLLLTVAAMALAQQPVPERPRILISTDIGGTDPDDNQSMTHLMMYSDLFDIEGIVSSPSFGNGSKAELLRMIDLYAQDYPRLRQCYPGLLSPKALRRLCKQGRRGQADWRGYGEPTERLDALLEIASFVKETYGLPVRINTNGLGNLIHQKDITPLFAGKIDALSISLNSSDPAIYEKTVRPRFKEKAYPALLEFAQNAARYVPRVVLTTVATTITPEDEESCRALCARLGVTYRIRAFVA